MVGSIHRADLKGLGDRENTSKGTAKEMVHSYAPSANGVRYGQLWGGLAVPQDEETRGSVRN